MAKLSKIKEENDNDELSNTDESAGDEYEEDFMMQNVPDEGVEEELFETPKTKINKTSKKPKT